MNNVHIDDQPTDASSSTYLSLSPKETDTAIVLDELKRLEGNKAHRGYRTLKYALDSGFYTEAPRVSSKGKSKGVAHLVEVLGLDPKFVSKASDGLIAAIIHSSQKLPSLVTVPQDMKDRHRPQVDIMKEHARAVNMAFPAVSSNVFNNDIVCLTERGEYRKLSAAELNAPHLTVMENCGLYAPKDFCRDYIRHSADKRAYNPAKIALEQMAAARPMSVEEAKEIVFNFSRTYFFNDEEVANLVFAYFLVSTARLHLGVADALPPEFVPIIAGEQGCYKSDAIKRLFQYTADPSIWTVITSSPEKFFSDITLRSTAACMEFPEIENWLNQKNLNAFKAAVTDAFPEGRRPYDSAPTKRKRMSVWLGTTNNPDCVLIDRTSSYDRRFIPIRIASGTFIDTEGIERDREKIWAAAVTLVRENSIVNPHSLPSSLFPKLFEYQEEFFDECPLQETALAYARGCNIVHPKHMMMCCFNQDESAVDKDNLRDVKAIYKKYLLSSVGGFEYQKERLPDGTRPYCYVRKEQYTDDQLTTIRDEINQGRKTAIRFDDWYADF